MKRGGLSVVDERIAEEQTYCEGTNVHAGSLIFATTDTEAAHEERLLWLSVNYVFHCDRVTLHVNEVWPFLSPLGRGWCARG